MKKCFTTCFKRNKTKIPDVYVLLLENGKYYIGETLDKKKRILNHNYLFLEKKELNIQLIAGKNFGTSIPTKMPWITKSFVVNIKI